MSKGRSVLLTVSLLSIIGGAVQLVCAQTENNPARKFDEFGDIQISA
jgi:hypothetical protein